MLTEPAAFDDDGLHFAAVGRFDAQLDGAVGQQQPVAGWTLRARPAKVVEIRPGPPTKSPVAIVSGSPARRWIGRPPSSLPVRIFGPPRSCRIATSCPARCAALRTRAKVAACDSWVPCEIQPDDVGAGGDDRVEHRVRIGRRADGGDDFRVPHVESFSLWARLFPTPSSAIWRPQSRRDPVLVDIARAGAAQDLPLVDAEVGALLRVLATAVGARGSWRSARRSATPASGWPARCHRRHAADDGDGSRAGARRAGQLRARRRRRTGQRHRRRRAADDRESVGTFDLIFQDGSKPLYVPLLDRLVALLRPGGLLVTDNVLWDGEVVPGFVARRAVSPKTRGRSPNTTSVSTRIRTSYGDGPAPRRCGDFGEEVAMTVDAWLNAAIADAERRGLPELKPLLEGLAQATRALRAAGFSDRR